MEEKHGHLDSGGLAAPAVEGEGVCRHRRASLGWTEMCFIVCSTDNSRLHFLL